MPVAVLIGVAGMDECLFDQFIMRDLDTMIQEPVKNRQNGTS
jgi:hypothetical protein